MISKRTAKVAGQALVGITMIMVGRAIVEKTIDSVLADLDFHKDLMIESMVGDLSNMPDFTTRSEERAECDIE